MHEAQRDPYPQRDIVFTHESSGAKWCCITNAEIPGAPKINPRIFQSSLGQGANVARKRRNYEYEQPRNT